jgi:hypothetical protein
MKTAIIFKHLLKTVIQDSEDLLNKLIKTA